MRTEYFNWNNQDFLIYITKGRVMENNGAIATIDEDKFGWAYNCLNNNQFNKGKDLYITSDEAVIGAMAHIMTNK